MANIKTGFSYYNSNTDRFQDIRIKKLKKNFGCDGYAIYEYILNEIYRVRGCFIAWDESTAFDVAEYWGMKETKVNEIVRYCCAVGLFDKTLLSNGNVLTSPSIQSRFVEMCIRAKRKEVLIPEEYKIIPEECEIIPEECRNQKKKENEKKSNTKEKINKKEKKESISKDIPKKENLSLTVSCQKQEEKIDFIALLNLFNQTFEHTDIVKIKTMSETRKRMVKARIAEHGKAAVLRVFENILNSDFLMGNNKNGWIPNFDWIFKPTNFLKILEGNYETNSRANAIAREDEELMRAIANGMARGYQARAERGL